MNLRCFLLFAGMTRLLLRLLPAARAAVQAFVMLGSARPLGRPTAARPVGRGRLIDRALIRRLDALPPRARGFDAGVGGGRELVRRSGRPVRVGPVAPRSLASAEELAASKLGLLAHRRRPESAASASGRRVT